MAGHAAVAGFGLALAWHRAARGRHQPDLGLRQGIGPRQRIGITQVTQCCTPAGNCNTQDRVARPLEADHPQGQAPVPRHPRSSAGELCKQ